MKKQKIKEPYKHQPRTLPIKTVYYFRGSVLKINHALHANTAVPQCVYHMQLNRYAASTAEVYDESNGTLHAVIKRSVNGTITIVFKREVKEGM